MSTPEQIVDGTQAENSVSDRLARVIARLNRLPAKAGREGESPSVWKAFGECVVELEAVVLLIGELEEDVEDLRSVCGAVFSGDRTAWNDLKAKLGLTGDAA